MHEFLDYSLLPMKSHFLKEFELSKLIKIDKLKLKLLSCLIEFRSQGTTPVAEILCVKNGRAIVVCGFLME